MKRNRAGASLVELLVVITICGILMSTVGVCLHGMHRANQRTRNVVDRLDVISRLSLRFRQDAHEAGAVTEQAADGGDCLVLLMEDGRAIRYQVHPGMVERTVWQHDELRHRDGFRLPQGVQATWSIEKLDTPLVVIEIGRFTGGADESTISPDRIEAAVRGVIVLSPTETEP